MVRTYGSVGVQISCSSFGKPDRAAALKRDSKNLVYLRTRRRTCLTRWRQFTLNSAGSTIARSHRSLGWYSTTSFDINKDNRSASAGKFGIFCHWLVYAQWLFHANLVHLTGFYKFICHFKLRGRYAVIKERCLDVLVPASDKQFCVVCMVIASSCQVKCWDASSYTARAYATETT